MKTFIASTFTIFSLFLFLSIPHGQADEITIPEIENADFSQLARDAAADDKQLMMIYYQSHCESCEQLTNLKGGENSQANEIKQHYKIYKTNAAVGFNVACPGGDVLSENEFLSVKGITSFPAVVITDSLGNVEIVENNVNTGQAILAISEQFKHQKFAKRDTGNHMN